MNDSAQERRWFWVTLVLSSSTIVCLVFAFWELIENRFFRDLDYVSLHYLYISRGITASILLATWAAWFVTRQRRISDEQLRKSHERYRGLLEASPGAVILFEHNLTVLEWNASAEHLYGWTREEVLGKSHPTIPAERIHELQFCLDEVTQKKRAYDRETVRMNKQGDLMDVQFTLLPFTEANHLYFMEVTNDIRERVRLRQRLIELEKLTSMGQMAAGTAHHLNTPLASMLLRVQMMRERTDAGGSAYEDLQRLEHTIDFCQKFVRRLLDFSRRPTFTPQPEEIGPVLNAALGFLSPSFLSRQARVQADLGMLGNRKVLVDRNNLETLLLILLSNALDAIAEAGKINVQLAESDGNIQVIVRDDGDGISEADQKRIFEPFFTTKPIGKGTGLGLAIAKNIVTECGGDIHIQSALTRGTTATVTLPIHSVAGLLTT